MTASFDKKRECQDLIKKSVETSCRQMQFYSMHAFTVLKVPWLRG